LDYDIVIVGAGGAGLYAALQTSKEQGLKIAVLSKVFPTRSHTSAAQGGINAALGNVAPDSPEKHIYDTIKGSDFLADQDAVELMCNLAPKIIRELEHLGLPFSRLENGKISQRPFGGASFPRTCYAADRTGHVMLQTLYEQCLRNGVNFLSEWFLLSIFHDGEKVLGLTALEQKTGKIYAIRTKAIILATGGYARIYWKRTSNALSNTGDGIAVALRSGIPLKDMEFVQFHPTALFHRSERKFLISEAVRGEGAKLINSQGKPFMSIYDPRGDLAPRDIVTRAIIEEMLKNGEDCVYLDAASHIKKDLKERFPTIYKKCSEIGIDITREPIPVVPAAHYFCGGILVDLHGRTTIDRLYAGGECACTGVHGANRLASTSLLEG